MTGFQKFVFYAVIPVVAAGIGAAATYYGAANQTEQIILNGDAVQAAQDGKLTIEIIRRDEGGTNWALFAFPLMMLAVGCFMWLGSRD